MEDGRKNGEKRKEEGGGSVVEGRETVRSSQGEKREEGMEERDGGGDGGRECIERRVCSSVYVVEGEDGDVGIP